MKKLPIKFVMISGFIASCGQNQATSDLRALPEKDKVEVPTLSLLDAGEKLPNPAQLQTYARQLVGVLAGRPLKKEERKQLADGAFSALPQLLDGWLSEGFFENSFRARLETMIGTSGSRNNIDFNLPGNLAAYVVKEKLPIANLLTADYCVNSKMGKIKCDTGAPYTAGVLTTRGYLVAHNGRFNLGRALSMMNVFTCNRYPMPQQPSIEKPRLIENFRISTEEEAKAKGSTGFGNGSTCYVCHSQFAAHTQLYVKFDDQGLFKAEATGLQDAKLEFGRGENGTYASHFEQKGEASAEFGNVFGTDVDDLAAAARVLTESQDFYQCMAKNAIGHALGMDSEGTNKMSSDLIKEITSSIPKDQPKVSDVYKSVLVHPLVLKAFAKGVAE